MHKTPQKVVLCGAGFLGSYIAKALAAETVYSVPRRVQLTSRNPDKLYKTLSKDLPPDVLLSPVRADVTRPETLDPAFEGAVAVVSLVGIMHGSAKLFEEVQWKGAENVAVAAKKAGAKLVHMSAIGADRNSKLPYARTKALGEEAVLQTCADATVIRPSLVFGPGDGFFSRFATLSKFLPFLPVFGGGHTLFQPVYACDVARAVEIATRTLDKEAMTTCNGKIIEAGGPNVLSYRALMEIVRKHTLRYRPIVSFPYWVGTMQGFVLEKLPPNIFTLTRDQVEQLKINNIVNPSPGPNEISFEELLKNFSGKPPASGEYILPTYVK